MKVTVTFFLVLFAALAHSQIQNGGFETNQCTSTLWCDYGPGFFLGDDSWQVDSGSIDLVQTSDQFVCTEGAWCVDLSGGNAGEISQDFTTVPGHSYLLQWSQSGNYEGAPTDKSMSVGVIFANGAASPAVSTYSYDTTGLNGQDMGAAWERRNYYFNAPNAAATVYFTSNDATAYGMFLDAVTLYDVTSPGGFCSGVDTTQWAYGQGYYCTNSGRSFYQCYYQGTVIAATEQACALGTACHCPDGNTECSNHGTETPCQSL
jgi:hypothetical protein